MGQHQSQPSTPVTPATPPATPTRGSDRSRHRSPATSEKERQVVKEVDHSTNVVQSTHLSSLTNGQLTTTQLRQLQLDEGEFQEMETKFVEVNPQRPKCDRCDDNFSLSPGGHGKITVFPCGHRLCQSCIDYLMNDQRVIKCPASGCLATHDMSDRGSEWEVSTQSEDSSPATAKVIYCSEAGCNAVATHSCHSGCGVLCQEHDASIHLLLPDHTRGSFLELEAKKQQQREQLVQQVIQKAEIELSDVESKFNKGDLVAKRKRALKDNSNEIERQQVALAQIKRGIAYVEQQLQRQRDSNDAASRHLTQQIATVSNLIWVKRGEIEKAKEIGPNQPFVEFQQRVSLNELRQQSALLEEECKQQQPIPIPLEPIACQFNYMMPSLLPSLRLSLKQTLELFLKRSGRSWVNYDLIWKASEHGWTKRDFVRHCLGQSHTLILVKVARNGYVFGAYVAPMITEQVGGVPDPTKKSFLFSLINEANHPFRLSLAGDSHSAINLSGDRVAFGHEESNGQTVKWSNFGLFFAGKPVNDSEGIYSNTHDQTVAYQLDEESKKSLPPGFKFDENTFGGFNLDKNALGGSYFGASEIEVYAPPPFPSSTSKIQADRYPMPFHS